MAKFPHEARAGLGRSAHAKILRKFSPKFPTPSKETHHIERTSRESKDGTGGTSSTFARGRQSSRWLFEIGVMVYRLLPSYGDDDVVDPNTPISARKRGFLFGHKRCFRGFKCSPRVAWENCCRVCFSFATAHEFRVSSSTTNAPNVESHAFYNDVRQHGTRASTETPPRYNDPRNCTNRHNHQTFGTQVQTQKYLGLTLAFLAR